MKKHILIFFLVLALCLSMIPTAGAVYAAQPSYTVIPTGIDATNVDILDNGYCGYKVIDGYEIPRKGIIAPSGKAVVTRDFGDDPIYMGVYGTTHAVGYGDTIIDLPIYLRHSADGTESWEDLPIYDTNGKLQDHVSDQIKRYARLGSIDAISISHAFWGDGYLTVSVDTADGNQAFAYILDLRKMEICFSMQTYDYGEEEGAEIYSVNEGLIAYEKTRTTYGDNGLDITITEAGWMDLSGKQMIAIDPDKYVRWEEFSGGRAAVLQDSPRGYGYVDKTGKLVIPCEYDNGGLFMDGYAAVSKYVQNAGVRFGYIDTSGKTVIPFQYEDANGYGEGLFTVAIQTMKHPDDMFYSTVYGMVDKNNTTVVPFEYDAITPVKNGAAYAIKDGKVFVLKFAEPSPVDPNDISNIFTDVPVNAWYAGYLQKAYDNKIVGGTSADKYSPTAQLTHAQIMVMVAQLHSKQKGDNYSFAAHQKAGAAWYQTYEDYCVAEGIIPEAAFTDPGLFKGQENKPVKRGQMAFYFAHTLTDDSYKDKQKVSLSDIDGHVFAPEIERLAKANIVGGYSDGTFKPGNLVTRAEASVFLANILDAME
ncbi:MAG: WG repeat-containing protein [Firmicutes bacterium]|nr:WG repeat-containing protein [Bacillota bacterium]